MSDKAQFLTTNVQAGTQHGLRTSVRQAYAGVTSEPLPNEHVDLLLALRRRERRPVHQAA